MKSHKRFPISSHHILSNCLSERYIYPWIYPCQLIVGLPRFWHRFRYMANYWFNFRCRQGLPVFSAMVAS